jgi:hypothetical protein
MYMNKLAMYVPIKEEKFTNIKGKGYTQKGKNNISYTKLKNGEKVPMWIQQNKGYLEVIKHFENLIKLNYDRYPLARYFNISPATCKNFIIKKLTNKYQLLEKNNFVKNQSIRRSLSAKGVNKKTKGKTYEQIYGRKNPGCGFKKGDKNPNFTRNKFIGCTIVNVSGKKFRSTYEAKFSDILEKNNILYDYEHQFKLCNNKVKIVDFIIKEQLVEVTGYAYEKWKQDFDTKINLLHTTYPTKKIVIISSFDKIQELKEKHNSYATILNLDNEEEITNYFLSLL